MPRKKQHDIIHRWEGNPAITMEDLPFKASDICNAGAVKIDNIYLLLVTIETLRGHKEMHIARSEDGRYFDVDAKPFIEQVDKQYEDISVMDGRITPFEDTYFISYVADSHYGYRLGLARTDDFKTVTRLGFVSEVDTKGGALFPEKIRFGISPTRSYRSRGDRIGMLVRLSTLAGLSGSRKAAPILKRGPADVSLIP